jgi:hypothetical protein
MPEKKKATLKQMLTAEARRILKRSSGLKVVTVADGARDNWEYFDREFEQATPVVDFYHAAERLKSALDAAYGETSPKGRAQFERLRRVLLEERRGAEKVIRALVHLRDTHPRRARSRRSCGTSGATATGCATRS